jgi:beta-phosphoglucomutase
MSLAVIFDVDGVLVDSYRAHFRSWRDVAVEAGVEMTEAEFATTFGRRSRDIIRHFFGPTVTGPAVAEMDDRKEARFRELIADEFPAMDGAVELIRDLQSAGFRLALGSSGPPANVELVLARLGMPLAFSAVVTCVDVTRGKPDPQVFQVAAERLGADAARCAVIEDAPTGIAAAHAAGMTSIALLSTGRRESDFADTAPDLVVHSLRELSAARISGLLATPR